MRFSSPDFCARNQSNSFAAKTIDLEVPADVDFVLEGYVQPGETRPEGPFGDHTGFYTAVEDYPVFHLTAITHRRDAIYPPPSWAFRRWKIFILATRAFGFFCRSSR